MFAAANFILKYGLQFLLISFPFFRVHWAGILIFDLTLKTRTCISHSLLYTGFGIIPCSPLPFLLLVPNCFSFTTNVFHLKKHMFCVFFLFYFFSSKFYQHFCYVGSFTVTSFHTVCISGAHISFQLYTLIVLPSFSD